MRNNLMGVRLGITQPGGRPSVNSTKIPGLVLISGSFNIKLNSGGKLKHNGG